MEGKIEEELSSRFKVNHEVAGIFFAPKIRIVDQKWMTEDFSSLPIHTADSVNRHLFWLLKEHTSCGRDENKILALAADGDKKVML